MVFGAVARFNAHVSVGNRIRTGFGIVLALLVAMSAVGWIALEKMDEKVNSYEAISTNSLKVAHIEVEFGDIRRLVRYYKEEGKTETREAIERGIAAIGRQLDAAIAATIDAERRATAEAARASFRLYAANVPRMTELRARRDQAIERGMNPLGAEAQQLISATIAASLAAGEYEFAAYAGAAQEAFVLVRIYALRYLAHADPALIAAATRQYETFGAALARAQQRAPAERRAPMARIAEIAPNYFAAFRAAMEASDAFDKLVDVDNARAAQTAREKLDTLVASQAKALGQIASEVHAMEKLSLWTIIGLGALALLMGVAAAAIVSRGIVRPVAGMTDAMRRLAGKDMTVEIPAKDNRDEIGAMAAAVQIFKDNMIRADALEAESAKEREARERRTAKVLALTQAFDETAGRVVKALADSAVALQKNAAAMSATAEETSRQSTAVAAASEQASTNVQTVASAAEELSSSIQEISRQVSESSGISRKAVDEADRTAKTVQDLAAAASRIGSVAELIANIAGQTNLLALNATIEAARAGEAGKGFAVVASEVKNLASQTAKATEDISAQIGAIQNASQDTVRAIEGISGTIRRMNEIAAAIAAAVEEQGSATSEIARNVQQASAGTSEVSSNISGVTQAASETGSVAGHVREGADEVSSRAGEIKREVESFLASVRAA